jgi:hypothetical protein
MSRLKLTARCPNDANHKQFVTTCHVTEEWLVDEHGEFIVIADDGVGEVVHGPDPDNEWTCAECGVEAVVTRD